MSSLSAGELKSQYIDQNAPSCTATAMYGSGSKGGCRRSAPTERADGACRQSVPASGIMHDARSLAHLDREAVREGVRLVWLVQQLESWQSHKVQPTQITFAFRAIAPHAYVCAPS